MIGKQLADVWYVELQSTHFAVGKHDCYLSDVAYYCDLGSVRVKGLYIQLSRIDSNNWQYELILGKLRAVDYWDLLKSISCNCYTP